jgi:2-polyprenyl-6-methoxyphenol hydroxylase-like FAD-dependent oxidoreductase
MDDVIIIGGGITGLALALSLHQIGIACRVYESASEFRKLGVGINLQPHGVRELTELGLGEALERVAVATSEMLFFNRFGQRITGEPRGREAGYPWPQLSIHRGELHAVQYEAVRARLGADRIRLDHRCTGIEQDADGVTVRFANGEVARGSVAIGCDGIHSVVRKALNPGEGPPAFHGINLWRGVTRAKPFLTGRSMVQIGWLDVGKLVIYPIQPGTDPDGTQLINWTAEIRSPEAAMVDWNRDGRLDDVLPTFESFRFDWLDAAALLERAEMVLEYPMADRDPIDRWTHGRITLVGDAAHPMYPRGGNGAVQGIIDARTLAGCLQREATPEAALLAYEAARLEVVNRIVLMNRAAPPDTVLKLVHERTGDRPFKRIEDVISAEELAAVGDRYKRVAGFERESLAARASLVR